MIDAYFSRLEHLLVILLAFANYDRSKHDLVRVMSGLWSDKFKAIFNFEKDAAAKVLHDRLTQLRERKSVFTAMKPDYERACALFDEVDEFLQEDITKYGLLYSKSGLDVAYDEKSIKKYRAAATNEETFNEFLEHESYIADMHANMDW